MSTLNQAAAKTGYRSDHSIRQWPVDIREHGHMEATHELRVIDLGQLVHIHKTTVVLAGVPHFSQFIA